MGKVSLPFNALELKEEVKDEHWVHEVDEGVSNIALSLYEYDLMIKYIITFRSMGR